MNKKTQELKETIEQLGSERKYQEQAAAFLEATGAKIEARFVAMKSGHFGKDDKEARDIYEVRITKGTRSYCFFYGDSVYNTEKRIDSIAAHQDVPMGRYVRKHGAMPSGSYMSESRLKVWEKKAKEWQELGAEGGTVVLDAYGILSSLQKYEPEAEIDDFAATFGITSISEAVRAHKAVHEEWRNLRTLFSDSEIEAMAEIQ